MKAFSIRLFLLMAVLFATAACSGGDDPLPKPDVDPTEATFTSTIEVPATKVENNNWVGGEEVGIFMVKSGTSVFQTVSGMSNTKYTAAVDGVLSPTSTKQLYPADGSAVSFVAYYPYSVSASSGSIAIDLSSTTTDHDLIVAKTGASYSKDNTAVALSFAHVLSKIQFTVQDASGAPVDASKLTVAAHVNNQGTYSVVSNTLTVVSSIEKNTELTVQSKDGATIAHGILLPSTTSGTSTVNTLKKVTFSYDGIDYTWSIDETGIDMDANTQYNYVVKLPTDNTEVTVIEQEAITGWGVEHTNIPTEDYSQVPVGFSFNPETLNADQAVTIRFKADTNSDLYNFTGDCYLHTGVIIEGHWNYVPTEWDENIDKNHWKKLTSNIWEIKLEPSIREWFASGESPVNKLGLIIRSADGTKKGLANDYFVSVTDNQYEGFVPDASKIKQETMPAGLEYGINKVGSTQVTIVLYDKDTVGSHHEYAYVVGDMNNWTLANDDTSLMKRDDAAGCWWITYSGLDATKEYHFQYYIGDGADTFRMADAYSRKILDQSNDKYIPESTYPSSEKQYPTGAIGTVTCFKIQEDSYNWRVPNFQIENKKDLVIYELHLRDFTETHDLAGAKAKLDYLVQLGVDAIELMPTQEFDGNDSWGYNPCFYFAMDKAYGTDADYKDFIDACHEKGLAVILDVVYNHATGASPLARLYWDSANNKTASNNPYFNVDAKHPYNVYHDFNHESTSTRQYFKRNLKFLLNEYKFDGFRFDLAKGLTQNAQNGGSTSVDNGAYDASRVAIINDYHSAMVEANPNAMMILEGFMDNSEETAYADEGIFCWRNCNEAFCETAMGWAGVKSTLNRMYEPKGNWVSYMCSHDEERPAFKQFTSGHDYFQYSQAALSGQELENGMKQIGVNLSLFLTAPGPKMVWQFDELGYDYSIEENGRTGSKPIKWDYFNTNGPRRDLYNTFSKIMELRNNNEDLFDISSTISKDWDGSHWDQGNFTKLTSPDGTKHLLVVANFSGSAKTYSMTFQHTGTWTEYMSDDVFPVNTQTMTVNVPAYGFKIFTDF